MAFLQGVAVTLAGLGYFSMQEGGVSNVFKSFIQTFTGNEDSQPVKHSPPANVQRLIQIQPQPMNDRSYNTYALPIGSVLFVAFGAYYYYSNSESTKKVISKVEITAEETQDLVVKSDVNNAKRFEILDEKSEERSKTMETEIRSEQRAGFEIVSEQLYCLTQVAIQTLSAIAHGSSDNNGEFCANEKLLGYADKAQGIADTILSEEHMLKTKQQNLNEIRAEIDLRHETHMNVQSQITSKITPGGPYAGEDEKEMDSSYFTSTPAGDDISRFTTSLAKNQSLKKSISESDENGNEHKTFYYIGKQMAYLKYIMKPVQAAYKANVDSKKIIGGGCVLVGVYLYYRYSQSSPKQNQSIIISAL